MNAIGKATNLSGAKGIKDGIKRICSYLSKHFQACGHFVDIACWNSYNGMFFQPNEDGEDKTTFQAE